MRRAGGDRIGEAGAGPPRFDGTIDEILDRVFAERLTEAEPHRVADRQQIEEDGGVLWDRFSQHHDPADKRGELRLPVAAGRGDWGHSGDKEQGWLQAQPYCPKRIFYNGFQTFLQFEPCLDLCLCGHRAA